MPASLMSDTPKPVPPTVLRSFFGIPGAPTLHSQFCQRRPLAGVGGPPGDRPVCARLWNDPISFQRHVAQWPASGDRYRCHCIDGRAQDPKGNNRGVRLAEARMADIIAGVVAGTLQSPRVGERLSDRQPEAARRRCRQRPSSNGGTNIILPPNAAAPATTNTGTTLRSSIGSSLRRNGTSMMQRSTAVRRLFDNPDHVAIVIHNYRWRLGLAEGEVQV